MAVTKTLEGPYSDRLPLQIAMDNELYTIIDEYDMWWGWAQRRPGTSPNSHPNTTWLQIVWWDFDEDKLSICHLSEGDVPCPKNWIML